MLRLLRKLLVLLSGEFEQDLIKVLVIFCDFVPGHGVVLLADVKWLRVEGQILPVPEVVESLEGEILVVLHRPCELFPVVCNEIVESDDIVVVLIKIEDFLYTSITGQAFRA